MNTWGRAAFSALAVLFAAIVTAPADAHGDVLAPSEPRNLRATAEAEGVVLSWDSPAWQGDLVEEYRVYRGTSPDDLAYRSTTATRTYRDSFVAGSYFYYAVSAVTFGREGPKSAVLGAGSLVPGAPDSLTAKTTPAGSPSSNRRRVTLTWDPPSYSGAGPILGYSVAGATAEVIATTDSETRTVSFISDHPFFVVRAVNAHGPGAHSTVDVTEPCTEWC